MTSQDTLSPTPETWREIIRQAYALFDDLESRGFGKPPFSLGGGTALMLAYEHRLSNDVDLFTYDVQWLSLFTPRLNAKAAAIALDYAEQANSVKITIEAGDIDFIVAADVTTSVKTMHQIAGRDMAVESPSEILAKKLFYRAAALKPRDVYDMSATMDLAPNVARLAMEAAVSKKGTLLRRLDELATMDEASLHIDILPYNGPLRHSAHMVAKVRGFVAAQPKPEP